MSHHIWRSGNHHSHVVSVSSRSSPKLSRSRPRRRGRSADRGIPRFLLQTHSGKSITNPYLLFFFLQKNPPTRGTEILLKQSLIQIFDERSKHSNAFYCTEIRRKFLELENLQDNRLDESSSCQDEDSKWRLDDSPEVTARNRYSNIAAWEHNRIKLDVPSEHCNYINASPITLHSRKDGSVRRYICTQVRRL